jgi:hypothetical protein
VSLERDESIDLATACTVRLADRDFSIAPLSLRQVLAVADQLPKMAGLTAENVSGERLAPIAEIVWQGLRRAYPQLTREEFFDLPITVAELVAALSVVMQQAGARKRESGQGELEPHRAGAMGTPAQAASDSMKSTGERSSPIS